MNTPNAVLMKQARESLAGKWTNAVLASLVLFVIAVVLGMIPLAGRIATLIISGPLAVGAAMFWLALARGETPEIGVLFKGFNYFVNTMVTYLWMILFIILWTLLLIVPGIIATYSYSMTFFILADQPTMIPRDAISMSKTMMQGNKWKFFFLSLRFIGWTILALLTCGIGFLWLMPYMKVSAAKFYEDIKNSAGTGTAAEAGA